MQIRAFERYIPFLCIALNYGVTLTYHHLRNHENNYYSYQMYLLLYVRNDPAHMRFIAVIIADGTINYLLS